MRALASILGSFEKPDLTAEQWAERNIAAERFDREQAEARRRARIARSGIPEEFLGARLELCEAPVRAWRGPRGLLLQGEWGSGKTYAACAVLIDRAADSTVRFATMGGLLREIKACWGGSDSEESVMRRYANVGVLALDDVGKEQLTEWSLPLFFAVVDTRWSRRLPTVVTTNYAGAKLMERFTVGGDRTTAKAIVSRMATYGRVVLESGDRRLAAAREAAGKEER